jgi:hypothetical protein
MPEDTAKDSNVSRGVAFAGALLLSLRVNFVRCNLARVGFPTLLFYGKNDHDG